MLFFLSSRNPSDRQRLPPRVPSGRPWQTLYVRIQTHRCQNRVAHNVDRLLNPKKCFFQHHPRHLTNLSCRNTANYRNHSRYSSDPSRSFYLTTKHIYWKPSSPATCQPNSIQCLFNCLHVFLFLNCSFLLSCINWSLYNAIAFSCWT